MSKNLRIYLHMSLSIRHVDSLLSKFLVAGFGFWILLEIGLLYSYACHCKDFILIWRLRVRLGSSFHNKGFSVSKIS